MNISVYVDLEISILFGVKLGKVRIIAHEVEIPTPFGVKLGRVKCCPKNSRSDKLSFLVVLFSVWKERVCAGNWVVGGKDIETIVWATLSRCLLPELGARLAARVWGCTAINSAVLEGDRLNGQYCPKQFSSRSWRYQHRFRSRLRVPSVNIGTEKNTHD